MRGMTEAEWRAMRYFKAKPVHVEVPRHADMPGPVDEDQLKREAEAGRELMKELQCSNSCRVLRTEAPWPLHRQTLT